MTKSSFKIRQKEYAHVGRQIAAMERGKARQEALEEEHRENTDAQTQNEAGRRNLEISITHTTSDSQEVAIHDSDRVGYWKMMKHTLVYTFLSKMFWQIMVAAYQTFLVTMGMAICFGIHDGALHNLEMVGKLMMALLIFRLAATLLLMVGKLMVALLMRMFAAATLLWMVEKLMAALLISMWAEATLLLIMAWWESGWWLC